MFALDQLVPGCDGCELSAVSRYLGATAAVGYEWRRDRTVRPYLFGGLGLYYSVRQERLEAPCLTSGGCPPIPQQFTPGLDESQWMLGPMVTAGVAFRLRAFDLLLELPVHGIGRRRNSFPSPLTIGVRF
jgi:hypothetical protein